MYFKRGFFRWLALNNEKTIFIGFFCEKKIAQGEPEKPTDSFQRSTIGLP